ncbi:hypothetical protein ZWY2020_017684 [Hordeum vulgare]|nr:hypothetical protein ZWY2020_017684 [Hordeum vulgare]
MPPRPPGSLGRGRGRGLGFPAAKPVPTSLGARGRLLPRHRVLHFDVPIINGREIISVGSNGLLTAARSISDDEPVIFVDIDIDGSFLTDHDIPGEPFETMDQLIHAASVHLLVASCCDLSRYEGGTASSQMPVSELQHLHYEESRDQPCEGEDHVPVCSETPHWKRKKVDFWHGHDLSSSKELLNTITFQESSTSTSSSSLQIQAQPWRCLSSSPIWALAQFDWGIIFFTRVDLKGSFHTNPHVGGPFQSLQDAYDAIDRYLQEHKDPTMFTGVSRLERVIRLSLNYPDGTRKKLLKSQQMDERRDWERQLVQTLVDQYNDHHHLSGDLAYELKDVTCFESVSGGNGRRYYHIDFTMKTKGADDCNSGGEDLFFAEVTIKGGEYVELVASCFCMVKPTDNGQCYGCDVKHPNNSAAYTGAKASSQCACSLFGNMGLPIHDESLEEEERRVRRFYETQGLDDPDYVEKERARAQVTIKPFSSDDCVLEYRAVPTTGKTKEGAGVEG